MLFEASNVYAPNQLRGDAGTSGYQDMSNLGRWDELANLRAPNVLIGLVVLAGLAYYLHRRARR